MDLFQIETSPHGGTTVILGKERLARLPRIHSKQLQHITRELARRVSEDPLAEMQLQNQEMLRTLEALRVQQEERQEHLDQMETLNTRLRRSIQATHHRVKNNLQIISAIVEIQTLGAGETVPTAALARIGQHTRALAVIHDLLTEETKIDAETEVVSAASTMGRLMSLLHATAGGHHILYHADDFMLPARDCASLALLVSEIVSNGLKHGKNEIKVTLTAHHNCATLEVCDDGPGFPPDFNWAVAANTGLSLIDSAGRHDLRGTITYGNRPTGGGRVTVVFPIKQHAG
jgi:two-component sensor histidine kinase